MLGAMAATRLRQSKMLEASALSEAGGACQSEGRIEVGSCHADLGVGGNDILLGLGDVRPARQELGG